MPHKIAIITSRDVYYGYDEDQVKIVESITDWEEVSDEDFKTLNFAAGRLGFVLIEQPVDTKQFIAKTITQYKAIAEAEVKEAAAEKAKREQASLERKLKKELKTKESKIELLKKLKEELGEDGII
jgi:hypothetical protein